VTEKSRSVRATFLSRPMLQSIGTRMCLLPAGLFSHTQQERSHSRWAHARRLRAGMGRFSAPWRASVVQGERIEAVEVAQALSEGYVGFAGYGALRRDDARKLA